MMGTWVILVEVEQTIAHYVPQTMKTRYIGTKYMDAAKRCAMHEPSSIPNPRKSVDRGACMW